MKYFGTDGIRGKVNEELYASFAFNIGKALSILKNDTLVIGWDTRESNYMLAYALASGAMSMGIKVIMADVIPTPALIYYSHLKRITGVMITASHNPYYDNGLKILNNGQKLTDQEELDIEQAVEDNISSKGFKIGSLINSDEPLKTYESFMKKFQCKTNLKIALDCANGATYKTAPMFFSDVTSNLFVMANNPNGVNINEGVGSTHINSLKQFVIDNKCDVGFAFDGDGDRVIAVDRTGEILDGDKLIFIIANYLHENKLLKDDYVVFTKMSNLGMLKHLRDNNINVKITDVGDKNVVRALLENNYSIGGESSGHIIMPDILLTGDGTLNALFLLKIMVSSSKTLNELSNSFEMYPDKTVNVKVRDKSLIMKSDLISNRVNEIKKELGTDSKVIVRASGTEQLIRVSVSCMDINALNKYLDELVGLVNSLNV